MFQKARERKKERRAERKENKTGLKVAAGVGAIGAGVAAYKKKKKNKAEAESSSSSSSESDMDDCFEIKHPSEYTVLEVRYFLMAIGMEDKCDIFEEKQVNGEVMITLTKKELEVEFGCSSIEIKKFMAAVEFSFEICEGSNKPDTPTCKPPKQWTEAEVCLIFVAIGMGSKVAKIKQTHITGAVAVSLTTVELSEECGMTTFEVKKFKAVIVKGEKGGCGIDPDVDTMPSEPIVDKLPSEPNVDKPNDECSDESSGPNKAAIIGGAVIAGVSLGYLAWKKRKEDNDEEPKEEIQQEENVDPEFGVDPPVDPEFGVDPPSIKHPCDFTYIEVQYFLIAIGMENKCEIFEEKQVDGKVLVTLTKTELEAEFGCTSIEVRKFTLAIEFSIEIAEDPPKPESPSCGSKPAGDWSEIEVCLVLVAIGCGSKVKEFRKCQVSGAMVVSMTKVELQQECGMTTVEVKKFKAVAVKTVKC